MKYLSIVLLFSLFFIVSCLEDTPKKCEEVEDTILFGRDDCWTAKARDSGDTSYCEKVKRTPLLCYASVARELDDPSVCNELEKENEQSECRRIYNERKIDQKVSVCRQLTGDDKKNCLVELAVETDNADVCINADDKDSCIMSVAAETGNRELCNDVQKKEDCLQAIPKDKKTEEIGEQPETCTWDYQCNPTCEGSTRWRYVCNGRTNKCEKWLSDDCSRETFDASDFTLAKTCDLGECVFNRDAVFAKQKELSNNVKDWLKQKQDLTKLMQESNNRCLEGLSDVTNKLIIDTAQNIAIFYGATKRVLGSASAQAFETLTESRDESRLSPEEFIAQNCNLAKAIPADLEALDKKIEKAQEQTKELDRELLGDYFRRNLGER